jgi:hypothetical protein
LHRGSTAAGWGEVGTKPDQLPYAPYLFSTSDSACNAALANADLLVGKAFCAPGVLFFGPGNDDVAYLQSRDFPFGTWGCSRAYISGANSSNVTIKLWHNDRLIFHLEHFNGSALHSFDNNGSPNGFDRFHWNQYANHNGFVGQATSRTTYRYEDNVHIREGEPVSCNQIGFTSLTPPAPPPPIDPPPPTGTLGKPGTPVYVP